MDSIGEHDQEMADGIAELMFVFDNLNDVDDRGIQALLREISSDTLTLALKGADETIKEKILKKKGFQEEKALNRKGYLQRSLRSLQDKAPERGFKIH